MRRVWSGKAAWRRRQGMAVRPHPPSAAAKQSASRARKQQAAQALAARECAAIQQALRTRAEQSWELAELIDACSRDPDMPHQVPEGCPSGLLAGACAHCDGVAWPPARVRWHRRALQRLAHVRATGEAHGSAPSAAGPDRAKEGAPRHPHKDLIGIMGVVHGLTTSTCARSPWHKRRVLPSPYEATLTPVH